MINIKQIVFYIVTILAVTQVRRILDLNKWTKLFEEERFAFFDLEVMQIIIESRQFSLSNFAIQVAWLTANFLILWLLTKVMHKATQFIPLITALIWLFLNYLTYGFQTKLQIVYEILQYATIFIAILIINYTATNKLPILRESVLLFVSLFSYLFLARILGAFIFNTAGLRMGLLHYINLVPLFVLLAASIGYYIVGIYYEKRKVNLEKI